MSSQLDWHGDDTHRTWLRSAFTRAAATANATPTGQIRWGWRDRSIGSRVDTPHGPRWLRVVAEAEQWADGAFWTGNTDADVITGVAKPQVLRHWEWTEDDHRLRAELMTYAQGKPCSATPELRQNFDLPATWWAGLHSSLDALATTPPSRTHLTQEDLTHRIRVFFGDRVDPTAQRWTVAHTDLHWANLLAPQCVLVDWEGWGSAPAGFDAATLYLHSLLVPEMAEHVRSEFTDLLSTREGLLAQLYLTGRMLLRINSGDYPDLVVPLHHNADRVIDTLTDRQ